RRRFAALDARDGDVDVTAELARHQRQEGRMGRQAERIEGVVDDADLEQPEQQGDDEEKDYPVKEKKWREEHGHRRYQGDALGARARLHLPSVSGAALVPGATAGKIARKTP